MTTVKKNKTITIKCSKCGGKGHIEGFSHISNGTCFSCMGAGVKTVKTSSISANRFILNQYRQQGFFPTAEQLVVTRIVCYGFEGHPTAEEWVMKDAEFYYLGQPVCRSSEWWKIPISEMPVFLKAWNTVRQNKIEESFIKNCHEK